MGAITCADFMDDSPKAKGVYVISDTDHLTGNLICACSNIGKKVARYHVLWTLGFSLSQVMILCQVRPAVA